MTKTETTEGEGRGSGDDDKPDLGPTPADTPEIKIPGKPISDMDPPGQDEPEDEIGR